MISYTMTFHIYYDLLYLLYLIFKISGDQYTTIISLKTKHFNITSNTLRCIHDNTRKVYCKELQSIYMVFIGTRFIDRWLYKAYKTVCIIIYLLIHQILTGISGTYNVRQKQNIIKLCPIMMINNENVAWWSYIY